MTLRIVLSVVLFALYGSFMAIWSRMLPQLQGISAAQALNDDSVSGNAVSQLFRSGDLLGGFLFVVMLVLLLAIWWRPLKKVLLNTNMSMMLMLLIAAIALVGCTTDRATNESEKSYKADVIEIQPNQTAFVIPAVGGNLASQAQFDSIEYLVSKKVPSKRITLDKTQLQGRYVTNEIVILVTRAPVARQWTRTTGTGTESRDQSLCGESVESIEVCFQIAVSAEIQEPNAATYLYYYPTDRVNNPNVNSVYAATALESIVDNQVHNFLVAYLADATGTRTLDDIIRDKVKIVSEGAAQTKEYFAKRGITIDHLGLGGELVLPPDIQEVRNRLYTSIQEKQISQNLGDAYNLLQTKKGSTDAENLARLYAALGNNAASVGPALEGYRWNGSRVTVQLAPNSTIGVTPDGTVVPQVKTGQ